MSDDADLLLKLRDTLNLHWFKTYVEYRDYILVLDRVATVLIRADAITKQREKDADFDFLHGMNQLGKPSSGMNEIGKP